MHRMSSLALAAVAATVIAPASAIETVDGATISDSTATFLGVNHIGISVHDLDAMLAFYRSATGFEVIRREKVQSSATADQLFGHPGVSYEVAVLRAPNMLLELREFSHNSAANAGKMPPQGPGMTHTCYQSRAARPGWDRFMAAGASSLSRGGEPVDLGGYGVTYGYAYDPEGNMMELEQLDGALLQASGYDASWKAIDEDLWMSQVALVTHDLERLMGWYQQLLGFAPYRVSELKDNPRADRIADVDNLDVLGGWFRISEGSKVLEMWQYRNPSTQEAAGSRAVTDLGYSYSFEVADIDAEYRRLRALGVEFIGTPVDFRDFRQVYARDIDGNIFALREALDTASALSVMQLEQR